MHGLLNKIKNKILLLRSRKDSEHFIQYLEKAGVTIGERTIIYSPRTTTIDLTRPHLIEIGKNVRITRGVVILTHGADWHVLRNVYKDPFVCGSAGKVVVGDNVFIGVNSIILKGVTIGSNSIIGAGSVVTKSIPSLSVAAGNPAQVRMDLETYYQKRKKEIVNEAKEHALEYWKRYQRRPGQKEFKEFFFLFAKRDEREFEGFSVKYQMGPLFEDFMKTAPVYESFEKFLVESGIPQSVVYGEKR